MDFSPIIISLTTAAISIVVTFFLGMLASFFVMSLKKEIWILCWDAIFTVPLVLPPTVIGFFLLYLIGVNRPIGAFFIYFFHYKIIFSQTAAVLAAVVISFPLMYRSARGAFEQLDSSMIEAAKTMGLSQFQIFYKIQIPNAIPGLLAGGILSFARGLGEFGATSLIAGNIVGKTRTLPLEIYSDIVAGNPEEAYLYVAVLVLISFFIVFLMNKLARKKYQKRRI